MQWGCSCYYPASNLKDGEFLLTILSSVAQQEVEINQKIYRITCSDIGGLSENENVILLAEDVTLRRIQEKQNIQNNKMMAIGELASGISHELKNPLEIICNYCYALKKGILHKK